MTDIYLRLKPGIVKCTDCGKLIKYIEAYTRSGGFGTLCKDCYDNPKTPEVIIDDFGDFFNDS